jgi:hypothetical protein
MKKRIASASSWLTLILAIALQTIIHPSIVKAQEQDRFTTRLWATDEPVCILTYNPNHEALALPEPYTPASIQELYGPGVTEDDLISLKQTPLHLRFQKIQVGANIVMTVTYADGANEGFNDPTLGANRRTAFEFGMGVWAANLQGPATISANATMTPRGGTANAATLASAAPAQYFENFTNAPLGNTWYPECLVEILSGTDPDDNRLDINVDFNSDVDNATVLGNTDFYYGTDALPGTNVDFATVTIHELCHGLGFLDSFTNTGTFGLGNPAQPIIFDRFLVDSTGALLINKTASANIVTSNNVFWSGLRGKYVYNFNFGRTNNVPMFAPTPYQGGSSVGHLDEATFNGIWELETPTNSSAVHVPDDIVLGILQDIGHSLAQSRYVDLNNSGAEDGSSVRPLNTLIEGINAVPESGALRLLPNIYRGPMLLNKKMIVHSSGGVATLGLR